MLKNEICEHSSLVNAAYTSLRVARSTSTTLAKTQVTSMFPSASLPRSFAKNVNRKGIQTERKLINTRDERPREA